MKIVVNPKGQARYLYTENLDLTDLGTMDVNRVSDVNWDPGHGGWTASVYQGPLLGPFKTRSEAVRAEVAWLENNRLVDS